MAGCDIAWSPDAKDVAVVQAGSECNGSRGAVKFFPAGKPGDIKRVAGSGSSPAYRPVK